MDWDYTTHRLTQLLRDIREIPQTDQFIAYDEIAAHLDQLPGKDAPIVLYCRSGNMSTSAALAMAGLGYTHAMIAGICLLVVCRTLEYNAWT
jgi:rhodanese-related sulfurtransferase